MAHSYFHAVSSAKKWGGKPEDYLAIHDWFDETKASYADVRHRALRHHSFGIFECEKKFGTTVTNSEGRTVPVRLVAEQHVIEDLGRIPTVQDWLVALPVQGWMHSKTTPHTKLIGKIEELTDDERETPGTDEGRANPVSGVNHVFD